MNQHTQFEKVEDIKLDAIDRQIGILLDVCAVVAICMFAMAFALFYIGAK
jgi:hypothetical protein